MKGDVDLYLIIHACIDVYSVQFIFTGKPCGTMRFIAAEPLDRSWEQRWE